MAEEASVRAKEPYDAPELRELGTVDDLTSGLPGDSPTDFDDN